MTFVPVHCPHCDSERSGKRGTTRRGTQRSLCQNIACSTGSLLLDYRTRGGLPEVKRQSIAMRPHARGERDTARSLHSSPTTVLSALKKPEAGREAVPTALLRTLAPERVARDIERAGEAEMDERWSCVGHQGHPRWLWHAIDQHTGVVLASVFGRRQDVVFRKLKALLEPFGLTHPLTDQWGAYPRHRAPEEPTGGHRHTQKIERKPRTLRTRIKRLVRKTLGVSKTTPMHDIVLGLLVNRSACGQAV
jgi:insertion element IS1 protein InsB